MVNSFHTNNLVNHLLIVDVNVFYKIQLGVSRPNNQDFLGAFQRFDNFVIEILILRCAARTNHPTLIRATLMMQMSMRFIWMHNGHVNIIRADMHNLIPYSSL